MRRPHTYAGEYTTKDECIEFRRVSEGEKRTNDIRQACKFEVQIWEQEILVQRILCRYSWTK